MYQSKPLDDTIQNLSSTYIIEHDYDAPDQQADSFKKMTAWSYLYFFSKIQNFCNARIS